MNFGLDQADKIASVVGAAVAVIALIVSVRQARAQQGSSPASGSGARPPAWLIAGLVVVVGCVIGSWGILSLASKRGDRGSDDDAPIAAVTSAATPSAGSTTPAGPADAGVLWKDKVLLDSKLRDFDTEPPTRNTGNQLSSDGYLNGSVYHELGGAVVVAWKERASPSRDECAKLLGTVAGDEVPIDSRSRICMKTSEGRIVFMKMLSHEDSGYLTEVTLWSSN